MEGLVGVGIAGGVWCCRGQAIREGGDVMAFIGPAIKAFLIIYKATSIALTLQEWWEGPKPDPWRWWRRIFWAVVIVLLFGVVGSLLFAMEVHHG